jgi:hypothetical protein
MSVKRIKQVIRGEGQADRLARLVRVHAAAGEVLMVTVEPYRHPKTVSQINYAHALIHELSQQCGPKYAHDRGERLKYELKRSFGPVIVETSLVSGERIEIPVSMADYSREQMAAFIEQVHAWASAAMLTFHTADEWKEEQARLRRAAA